MFGRQCLRVQWGPKLVGLIGTLVFVARIAAGHALFATFRFITASGVDAGVALNSLYLRQNLEGAANDGLSIVLVVLGGLVSALSFWKGMTTFSDRYPGFLELWRDLQQAHADFAAVTDMVTAEMAEIGAAAMAQLDEILSQAEAIYVAFAHELAELAKPSDQHRLIHADAETAANHALQVYAAANQETRIAPLPLRTAAPLQRRDLRREELVGGSFKSPSRSPRHRRPG